MNAITRLKATAVTARDSTKKGSAVIGNLQDTVHALSAAGFNLAKVLDQGAVLKGALFAFITDAETAAALLKKVIDLSRKSFGGKDVDVHMVDYDLIHVPFATERDAEKCLSFLNGAGGALGVAHLVKFSFVDLGDSPKIAIELKDK